MLALFIQWKEFLNEFFHIVFGNFTLVQLVGYIWFLLIGYFLQIFLEVGNRNISSPQTPVKWSWKFFWGDNWKRFITTILCTYVFFRFYNEISGHEFGNVDAIILGYISDNIAVIIKQRVKTFADDRAKLMVKMSTDQPIQETTTETINDAIQETTTETIKQLIEKPTNINEKEIG